jgi:glucose-1-phosphate cytidylyltransferase
VGSRSFWHIMMHYSFFGFNEFVIALGHKGEVLKKYMVDFCSLNGDLTVQLRTGQIKNHHQHNPDWTVDLVETGLDTMTGGRIKRLEPYLCGETFMLTWGDGVSNINLHDSAGVSPVAWQASDSHRCATPGALRSSGLQRQPGGRVQRKTSDWRRLDQRRFFVLEPEVFNYIQGDETMWEREPLERLAAEGQLMAYKHEGFWQCMDTLREKHLLNTLWESKNPPWKFWNNSNIIKEAEKEYASLSNRS